MALARLDDVRDARLICVLMEINRDREARRKPFTVDEFLLLPPEQAKPRAQSDEDMLLMVTALNNVFGGTVSDGQRN